MSLPLVLALGAVASPAQQSPIPTDEDLCRARAAALDALSDLLVSGEAVERLVRAADAEAESPALRYVLLRQAMHCAERTGELIAARDIAGMIADGFLVDELELRIDMLSAFERARSVPTLALLYDYLALAAARPEFRPGALCAFLEGSSLHAGVMIEQGARERLEGLAHAPIGPRSDGRVYPNRPKITKNRHASEPAGTESASTPASASILARPGSAAAATRGPS